MKRLSSFTKTQIILIAFIAVLFGFEANLRQINAVEVCLSTGQKQVCKTASHIEKIKCASDQTLQFIKTITQLFSKNQDRP